jgi:hypothetical protein
VITDSNFQVLPCGKRVTAVHITGRILCPPFFFVVVVLFLNFVVKSWEFWSHLRVGVDTGWICDMFSWGKEWGELFPVLEF